MAQGENRTLIIFSERLGALLTEREKQGRKITQLEIADAVDQDQSTVSKWLRGKAVPGADNVAKLADLFDVSVDWLLGRDNTRPVVYEPAEERVAGTESPGVRNVAEKLQELHDQDPKSFEVAETTIIHLHGKLTTDVNYKRKAKKPARKTTQYEQRGPAIVKKDDAIERAARELLRRASEQVDKEMPE